MDDALTRAYELFIADPSDEVDAEVEALLPPLIVAGYVDADEYTWRFTPAGVARATELGLD